MPTAPDPRGEVRTNRRYRRPLITPALATDAVILRRGSVLLVERGHPPFQGAWALPGGFVERGESVPEAIVREVAEETGLCFRPRMLIGVYSRPDRDPRGAVVSVAYLGSGSGAHPSGVDDARQARFFPLGALPRLAFDHATILRDALKAQGRRERLRFPRETR